MLLVGFLLGISLAFGGENGMDKPFLPSRALSLKELKRECVSRSAPPQEEIHVQCTDVERTWVAAPPGEIPLSASRKMTATAFGTNFHVEASQRRLPVAAKTGSCLRFKEIETTLTVESSVNCRQIAGLKGDLGDFCASVIDESEDTSPRLVEVRDTGKLIDNCGKAR